MGTGTPAVTVSGISAANIALRDRGMTEYRWRPGQRNFVTVVDGPVARPAGTDIGAGHRLTVRVVRERNVPRCVPFRHRYPWSAPSPRNGKLRRCSTPTCRNEWRFTALSRLRGTPVRTGLPALTVGWRSGTHRGKHPLGQRAVRTVSVRH